MIVPSIDLIDGRAVQLVRGREKVLDAGDPRPIAERFGLVGEIAVIDLDAAMGRGSNASVIKDLIKVASCRVGGGIRDIDTARQWLDAGATSVILGTAAREEILSQLPRERVIAALDAWDGEVVDHGWTRKTGRSVVERIAELRSFVSGFLLTFVEVEGTMGGLDAARVIPLKDAAQGVKITAAGGIKSAAEVAALDRIEVDAQVGMAIYTGAFTIADALAAILVSDRPDALWPTVVCDERGTALGLVYSSAASLAAAIAQRSGIYHSRTRGLWRKGETSGATQTLLRVDLDCDRDALRFTVRQNGDGFCHNSTLTCWGEARGLARLEQRLRSPTQDQASYTARLRRDPQLLASKLIEEASELAAATSNHDIVHEAADVIFFTLTRLAAASIPLDEVERELDRRATRLSRRGGDAKPQSQVTNP